MARWFPAIVTLISVIKLPTIYVFLCRAKVSVHFLVSVENGSQASKLFCSPLFKWSI